ncbi:MAG: hypothetical protein JXR66_06365 [Bacteroidales bacterium]|nr:hypothetical protein [Bacteroidales bacterium]MBN2633160.1 hypothetical protein [Bacteroidales bacterium]
MKKTILAIALAVALTISGITAVSAQQQPAPQKDTVNMDTEARPTQYYDIEDEDTTAQAKSGKTSVGLIIGIVAAVIVIGGAAVMLTRKKK